MKSVRPIALWLAAVIVTIAAVLMPSGARAHGAHDHGIQDHRIHGHGAPALPVTASAPNVTASDLSAFSASAATARLAGPSSIVRKAAGPVIATARMACACAACLAGTPCGHAPSSCCATGLTPSPVPALAPPAACGCAPTRDGPRLSGIVPEAQTEPPKPLA